MPRAFVFETQMADKQKAKCVGSRLSFESDVASRLHYELSVHRLVFVAFIQPNEFIWRKVGARWRQPLFWELGLWPTRLTFVENL